MTSKRGDAGFGNEAETLQQFFAGIQKYQSFSEPPRSQIDLPIVWTKGGVRLYRQNAALEKKQTPVFLLPSLVNGPEIFDLTPSRSMVSFLKERDRDVLLLDWGSDHTGQPQTLNSAIEDFLLPALASIGGPVILVGYCMGGLLAVAAACLNKEIVKGCILLATPWDFHAGESILSSAKDFLKSAAGPYVVQKASLPGTYMRAVFAGIDPDSNVRKFASFAAMEKGDPHGDLFVAVEDWLNSGADIPSNIVKACMEAWYDENLPGRAAWSIGGQKVTAHAVACPTLIIAAQKDKIVPLESALDFAKQKKDCDTLIYKGGHIGLIAGRTAVEDIWRPLSEWCDNLEKVVP